MYGNLFLLFAMSSISLFLNVNSKDAVCPDPSWQRYNGNCYKAFKGALSANEARKECQKYKGGDLCSIEDEGINDMVKGLCVREQPQAPAAPATYCFHMGVQLGRDYQGNINSARWCANGMPLTYGCPICPEANKTEPGKRPCWANGKAWNGPPEPKKGQNYKCGALVFNSKCPGDWVAEDCDEVKGGYVCIVHGGNPPPDSYECRQGYTAFGTKCYKVFDLPKSTVETAKSTCAADGAQLCTIPNSSVNDFILGLCASSITTIATNPDYQRIFIGFVCERKANGALASCKWVDGTDLAYGNPFVPGFKIGTHPWSDGKVYGGVAEPKTSVHAKTGFIVRNNLMAGGWCVGPLAPTINFVGAFCCETERVKVEKEED